MPLTSDQLEAAALSPQSTTIDGNSATARPAADVIALANYAAGLAAVGSRRPSLRCFKLIPPGTVGSWSGTSRPC